MEESILNTIKQMLGIEKDYNVFDVDVIVGINSAFYTLRQLGVGPREGYTVTGADETWLDFLDDQSLLSEVKTYTYLKTRLQFDPPTNSFLTQSIEKQITEAEWRLNVHAEGAFDE